MCSLQFYHGCLCPDPHLCVVCVCTQFVHVHPTLYMYLLSNRLSCTEAHPLQYEHTDWSQHICGRANTPQPSGEYRLYWFLRSLQQAYSTRSSRLDMSLSVSCIPLVRTHVVLRVSRRLEAVSGPVDRVDLSGLVSPCHVLAEGGCRP